MPISLELTENKPKTLSGAFGHLSVLLPVPYQVLCKEATPLMTWPLSVFPTPCPPCCGHRREGQEGSRGEGSPGCGGEAEGNGSPKPGRRRGRPGGQKHTRGSSESSQRNASQQEPQRSWEKRQREAVRRQAAERWVESPGKVSSGVGDNIIDS